MFVQPGFYPRINASMASSGRFNSLIVSLVGRVVSSDGTTLVLETGEQPPRSCTVDVSTCENKGNTVFVELIGYLPPPVEGKPEEPVQGFIVRDLGPEVDMGVYNDMLELANGKYATLFRQKEFEQV